MAARNGHGDSVVDGVSVEGGRGRGRAGEHCIRDSCVPVRAAAKVFMSMGVGVDWNVGLYCAGEKGDRCQRVFEEVQHLGFVIWVSRSWLFEEELSSNTCCNDRGSSLDVSLRRCRSLQDAMSCLERLEVRTCIAFQRSVS